MNKLYSHKEQLKITSYKEGIRNLRKVAIANNLVLTAELDVSVR